MTRPTDAESPIEVDELDLDDDHVRELSENRYVITPETNRTDDDESMAGNGSGDVDPLLSPGSRGPDSTLADAPEPHGIDVTLKTDGEITHHRVTSNDVREVFANLLTWYARQLDDDLSPTEALQVMLATTDLEE